MTPLEDHSDESREALLRVAMAAENLRAEMDIHIASNADDRDAALRVLNGTRTGVDNTVRGALNTADQRLNDARQVLTHIADVARAALDRR